MGCIIKRNIARFHSQFKKKKKSFIHVFPPSPTPHMHIHTYAWTYTHTCIFPPTLTYNMIISTDTTYHRLMTNRFRTDQLTRHPLRPKFDNRFEFNLGYAHCAYSHTRWVYGYRSRLRSLLWCSCDICRALINSPFWCVYSSLWEQKLFHTV